MGYSHIEVTQTTEETPLGDVIHREYKIVGDSPYVWIPNNSVEPKDGFIYLGNYKLKIIDTGILGASYYCIRVDYSLYHLVVLWNPVKRWLQKIERRIIMTLVIWNLADYHPASYISWKDIKIVKWFINRVR